MEILDKNLESVLKTILEENINLINVSVCKRYEINELIQKGYFTCQDYSTLSGWGLIVSPTQKGIYYFEQKSKFIKQQKWEKFKKTFKFWIPTIISLCSLAIAIAAFIKS